jgi:hypothetical protein
MSLALHSFYDNLTIIDMRVSGWEDELLENIGGGELSTMQPLRAVLNVATQLGAVSMVIENEYVDKDFLDEFQSFYCTSFREYMPKCQRLHFFEREVTAEHLPDLSEHGKDYLGYSIVRPIGSFRTSRTVLKPLFHDGDSNFTLCTADFEVNLSGTRLGIQGTPFIQQDTNVGVCAQASLWVTALCMHRKYGYPRFLPSEITSAATRKFTAGPIRDGLTHYQVVSALKEMGYSPLVFPHLNLNFTAMCVYAYMESELPVVLGVEVPKRGGHAIVVVGHDFNVRDAVDPEWDLNINWVDHFFAQDDATGPYCKIPIRKRSADMSKGSADMSIGSADMSIEENATWVFVPAPREVQMRVDDVLVHVKTLREHLNDLIDLFPNAQELRFSEHEETGLVFRIYLKRSADFKADLPLGMSETFRHVYRSMRMPLYVWVAEISKGDLLNHHKASERRIIGEIVIDSTADRHANLRSYLTVHLLGRMVVQDPQHPQEDMLTLYADPGEKPYAHLVRGPRATPTKGE